jgi:hypothetical protein
MTGMFMERRRRERKKGVADADWGDCHFESAEPRGWKGGVSGAAR